jgi:aspartate racemase
MMAECLGILGGMGPLATADFLAKLIAATPAASDQEHIPTLVCSLPQIPDRTAAIVGTGPSPLPALTAAAHLLEEAGAQVIAIPCNTAHHWHAALAGTVSIPVLHIAEAVVDRLGRHGDARPLGLLASTGTLAAGVYRDPARRAGVRLLTPLGDDQEALVMAAIRSVKAGDIDSARRRLELAARRLLDRGAWAVVMACTEIPVGLAAAPADLTARLVDATAILADRCVAWWAARPDAQPFAGWHNLPPRGPAAPRATV